MPAPETLERFIARVEQKAAYQRWAGERIVEETFFHDPAQRVPREPAA